MRSGYATIYYMTNESMPVRVDMKHYEQLAEIREVDGVPIAESLRRAIDDYYEKWKKRKESD